MIGMAGWRNRRRPNQGCFTYAIGMASLFFMIFILTIMLVVVKLFGG